MRALAVIVTLLAFILAVLPVNGQQEDRPNIVFLLADDLGWTGLGCYGSDFYETPNLDRLANEGIKLTAAYSACTVCSPTRASIMTGLYPARIKLTDFIPGQVRKDAKLKVPDWKAGLEHGRTTIAEVLKSNGYQTALVGKWHLNRKGKLREDAPTRHGFDLQISKPRGTKGYRVSSDGGPVYLTDYLTDHALKFIDDSQAKEVKAPFFLYFAYNVPHTPIQGRDDLVEHFREKLDQGRGGENHKNPVYAAMVASLDQSVGRILQRIDDLDLAKNTLVVFTSDNGGLTQRHGKHDGFTENLPLRRGKGSAYEGGVRVPAIIRWPGVTLAGTTSETPVISNDFFPTLVTAAGMNLESEVDGESLLPLLRDQNHAYSRDLFWHYPHYHAGGDGPYSAIRSGDWRLIEFHEESEIELYHLRRDIAERVNMRDSNPEKAQELLTKLKNWRQSVGAQMPTSEEKRDQ